MSDTPAILVVTSAGCVDNVVTPILAALEAVGSTKLRAIDAGRMGGDSGGAVDWVMKHLGGELLDRRLERELSERSPDAVLCFEPAVAKALCDARDKSGRPFPVVGVDSHSTPSAQWAQVELDRLFVVDDEAAVVVEDHGVPGQRILPVGAIGEVAFAQAGASSKEGIRRKFKMSGPVVLVAAAGMGAELCGQLVLQLSLVDTQATYLFDAGRDADIAAVVRSQVPVLGIKGKLFGDTDDAPYLWRCADVVVGRATDRNCSRALSVGAQMVSLSPSEGAELRRANALEERGRGAVASNALMVSSALEPLLRSGKDGGPLTGEDGAGTIADAMWIIGSEREAVIDERQSAASEFRRARVADASEYADWVNKANAPAGDLEDLGSFGDAPPPAPNVREMGRLRDEIDKRRKQATRTLADAQKRAQEWDDKRAKATKLGNATMAKQAERNADLERARMHSALSELASLDAEARGLDEAEKAAAQAPPPPRRTSSSETSSRGGGTSVHQERGRPSVEAELEALRRRAGRPGASTSSKSRATKSGKKPKKGKSAVDDELEALKRRMAAQKRKR